MFAKHCVRIKVQLAAWQMKHGLNWKTGINPCVLRMEQNIPLISTKYELPAGHDVGVEEKFRLPTVGY
jgi:hypothetical protein